jgi:hypothetical protein
VKKQFIPKGSQSFGYTQQSAAAFPEGRLEAGAATCFKGETPLIRGQDARDTDARDTTGDLEKQTQFQCTGAQGHKSQDQKDALEKQSQSRKNIEYRTRNIEFRNTEVPVEQSA